MTFEKLTQLLSDYLEVEVSAIDSSTTFDSLGIDSLDTVELIMELEEHLGTELELDEKIATVGELWAFVEKQA